VGDACAATNARGHGDHDRSAPQTALAVAAVATILLATVTDAVLVASLEHSVTI
jgi:hypothetical protein